MIKLLSNEVVAVILGGGAGTRLYPLTANRSKPAVPIAGKYRLVDIPISNCLNSGIDRMFVLTQYNSASLNRHIKNTYQFGAFSNGFTDILAAEQTPEGDSWYQGTADAVRQSYKHIRNHNFDYLLILSGDQLYKIDFAEMIQNHVEKNADISIATIPVTSDEAEDFGIMKINEESTITSFIEKPKKDLHADWVSDTGLEMQSKGRNFLASMGIYIFSKNAIQDLLAENPAATDFGKEIIPLAIENKKVISYQYNGYWTDIGNIPSFFEANIGLTADIPEIDLYDSAQTIYTRPRMLPAAKISNSYLDHAIIAEGSILLCERIEHSIIGIRSRIGFGSVIKTSYIMGCDYYETLEEIVEEKDRGVPALGIGDNCHIENALIDKNAHIGNNVIIRGHEGLENTDTPEYMVKDGIVVIKKNAFIPEGTIIQ
ncbi:glucose-1-phosphate adenylyltransferase [Rhizosphaericola mali]|uniref:Glucose-1-phosphate adenylyltransferase n=1 Tax=Rhizosphaericola mali TaxID=2545455 RepID=A0A5P2G2G0_9BACT|nr:glucose-1-phosphate adenylyltransferase [Rhizosphaericola mali]QES88012.1 glucose-1-phosphate adenylyltransferase [Rhizosphaericola mali]